MRSVNFIQLISHYCRRSVFHYPPNHWITLITPNGGLNTASEILAHPLTAATEPPCVSMRTFANSYDAVFRRRANRAGTEDADGEMARGEAKRFKINKQPVPSGFWAKGS